MELVEEEEEDEERDKDMETKENQKKKKKEDGAEQKKNKKPKANGEDNAEDGMISLFYTPVVWAKFQAYIGDIPPARSNHTAVAVPPHIRPRRIPHDKEMDDGADDMEVEAERIGCEQILIIGGRNEDEVLNDAFLLTLSDEG